MTFVESDFQRPTRHNPELHRVVQEILEPFPPGRVLDIPAGPGYLLQDLQERGFTGIAADIDTALHCLPGIEYVPVDMTRSFPFPDASFDYLISVEGIEHIDNHFAFLAEARRVLKDGGLLVLTTPNIGCLESRWSFLFSGFHQMEKGPIPLDTENIFFEHINPMTLSQIFFACERSGFAVERLTTSRARKGSKWLYALLWPWWRLGAWRACFRQEKDPARRRVNRRLYELLVSRENLLGGHSVVVARAR